MKTYSTRQAAQKLGLHPTTLADYIAEGKVPMPQVLKVGTASLHAWTDEEIEHVRQLLPKIANGRKTRYKKQSAKTKAQPKSAVPRKKRSSKKPKPASG
jgi:predicted DNA-binding transcriptional regulator AlpA